MTEKGLKKRHLYCVLYKASRSFRQENERKILTVAAATCTTETAASGHHSTRTQSRTSNYVAAHPYVHERM